jgi:rhodanese-related sulfurtransferase
LRSAQAAGILARAGYKVTNVSGGMSNWQRAGLRVVR